MALPDTQSEDESQAFLGKKDSILLRTEIKSWWVHRVMRPLENFCVRQHISPNALTLTGLALCFVCSWLYAEGKFLTAGWMVLFGASFDVLDGRVARATNRVTAQGAFLDAVIDRYQDFLLFAGLAIFFRESGVLYLILLALGGTAFVPYVRARAAMAGIDLAEVGAMQRPERIFLLGFGSIVSSIFQISLMPFYGKGNPPPQHLLILVLIIMAVATNLTAIRRIRYTMQALGDRK